MRSIFALLLLAISVSGATVEIGDWSVPPRDSPYYPNQDVFVGDTIVFTWAAGQVLDVHIHPTGTCEEDDKILVGYSSPASYTFQPEDAGKELFFACDVGRRCESGQNIKVLVSPSLAVSSIEAGVNSAANHNSVWPALALAAGFAAKLFL